MLRRARFAGLHTVPSPPDEAAVHHSMLHRSQQYLLLGLFLRQVWVTLLEPLQWLTVCCSTIQQTTHLTVYNRFCVVVWFELGFCPVHHSLVHGKYSR